MESNVVFDKLLNKNFSEGHNKNLLEQITNEHPYFTPAQFLLLQQTGIQSPGYKKQASKTALLFNNPHWLNFQNTRYREPVNKNDTPVTLPLDENILPGYDVNNDDDAQILVQQGSTEFISKTDPVSEIISNNLIPVPENTDNNDDEVLIQKETAPVNIEIPEAVASKPVHEVPVVEHPDNDDDEAVIDDEPLPIKFEWNAQPVNADDEAMLIEPMHMVDYFASQGIKLSEEMLATDKLGKQLKSFTEWLKTMKKIHSDTVEADTDSSQHQDKTIQSLAEKSNTEDEVLTESMAEVYMKQGKNKKAIEVYEKLSLFNPVKSAFFAAKIEYLKGI